MYTILIYLILQVHVGSQRYYYKLLKKNLKIYLRLLKITRFYFIFYSKHLFLIQS